MKRKARSTRKQKRKAKATKVYPEKYAFAVEAAKDHFSKDKVHGEVIEDGQGFAIIVKHREQIHRVVLRCTLNIEGKTILNDFLDEPEAGRPAKLVEAFGAVDKAIQQADERETVAVGG